MEIETVILDEINPKKPLTPKTAEGLQCIFYKTENCSPTKMKFKICSKCHRCQVITMENMIPRIFDKIVGTAIFMMATFGLPTGGSAQGTSSGSGGASSGGGGAGGGAGGGGH